MKRKKRIGKFFRMILCAMLSISVLAGCGGGAKNLMDGVSGQDGSGLASGAKGALEQGDNSKASDSGSAAGQQGNNGQDSPRTDLPAADASVYTDFALRLLRECVASPECAASPESSGSVLVSPLSVLNALAMTANGAAGETLAQMEEAFGADLASLCGYLSSYNKALPAGEKYKLHPANSIWFKEKEGFSASPGFLQTNADLFGADIYSAPFDASTLKDINNWVSENTDRMILEILDEIPAEAVMYLINALAFDAEWQKVYESLDVRDGIFTDKNGTEQKAEMMYSAENAYLADEQAQGFLKYYSGGKYAFAALLPNEGVALEDYVASLTGGKLHELLSAPVDTHVETAIPKFESEYGTVLNSVLKKFGMKNAFDSSLADFSGLGSSADGNLYISNVIHKTYIAVDERGTKAGAATAVEIKAFGAVFIEDPKTVYLDRPFLYMIIDCEENLPVFIGTLEGLE